MAVNEHAQFGSANEHVGKAYLILSSKMLGEVPHGMQLFFNSKASALEKDSSCMLVLCLENPTQPHQTVILPTQQYTTLKTIHNNPRQLSNAHAYHIDKYKCTHPSVELEDKTITRRQNSLRPMLVGRSQGRPTRWTNNKQQ